MITSVDFVLRHCCPPLATIEHENRSISNFLGPPPSLLLSEVCRSGTVEMLDWVWAASCTRVEERVQGWFLPNYLRSDPHYYRWQYVKSLYAAAERGDVEIVEWVFAHFSGCEAPFDVVKAAAREGHLHVLRVLCKHRDTLNSADADESSFAGHAFCKTPCTVKFKDGYSDEYYGDTVISKSIDNGEFVECLNDGMVLGCWDRRSAIKYALRIGNFELAERLLPAGECILKYGAGCPHPEVIKMMVDAGHERWTEYRATVALIDLAKTGNVELMQLLFQLYSPLREDQESWSKAWREALTAACKCGSLAVLQWLSEHDLGQQEYDGLKTESDTWIHNYQLLCAASHGHVDVMQYLYGKGLVTDRPEYAIEETIRKGHIEAVKWFVDHGFFNDQRHFGFR
ncbi:unnamed protein product [Phytophthora lilii]|uniref:Unnamed protein product n=1 Tax=Phytophthora lilii TaxID=2077276 RepID=A0A9W7CRJ8_9STRA|nr:unnamed protein product [Phytophthora lilii]